MPETLARSDDEEDKDDEEDASEDEGISFSQHHIFRHQLSEQCVSGTQTPAQVIMHDYRLLFVIMFSSPSSLPW